MDWTYANDDPNYDGPTNTHEKVNAANACVQCGYWFGSGSDFENHYYDHIWGPDAADCGGAYSLRSIYACYHLLECSCGAYRRGDLAHYEYYMYFNGNGNPPTHIILEEWQIKELGLPMP